MAWRAADAKVEADLKAGRLKDDSGATLRANVMAQPLGATPKTSGGVTATYSSSSSSGSCSTTEQRGTKTRTGYIGTYPTRPGVILVTPDAICGLIATGHSGLVLDQYWNVESISSGVRWVSNTWFIYKQQVYGLDVFPTNAVQEKAAVQWADRQVTKPYNYAYWDVTTRSKFYCSQLVWASFKDNFGVNLNTPAYDWTANGVTYTPVHPMELVNSPLTGVIYKMRP